jgi:hypothetical protein
LPLDEAAGAQERRVFFDELSGLGTTTCVTTGRCEAEMEAERASEGGALSDRSA